MSRKKTETKITQPLLGNEKMKMSENEHKILKFRHWLLLYRRLCKYWSRHEINVSVAAKIKKIFYRVFYHHFLILVLLLSDGVKLCGFITIRNN